MFEQFGEGGEPLWQPQALLDSRVRETRRRIHMECANYFSVDPNDSLSQRQMDNSWIDSPPMLIELFSANNVEIAGIESFDLAHKDLEGIVKVIVVLFAGARPHTLDEDLATLQLLKLETHFEEEKTTYFLLTSPEMPPQLINEAVFCAVGTFLEEKNKKYPSSNEILQFMQQQEWVHYLNDEDSAAFMNLLPRLQPDYESFIEERRDLADYEITDGPDD